MKSSPKKFTSLSNKSSFFLISWPARIKVMKVNSLIDVSENVVLFEHEEHAAGHTLALSVKTKTVSQMETLVEFTCFSDNKNELSTNCAEGPFWNLVQSSKPNREAESESVTKRE